MREKSVPLWFSGDSPRAGCEARGLQRRCRRQREIALAGRGAGILLLLGSLLCAPSHAAVRDTYVPPQLQDWVPWVLDGKEYRACPFLFDKLPGPQEQHRCAWPGALEIDATLSGARFTQSWQHYQPGWAELPGDAQYWPSVSADGRPLSVVLRGETPSVWLEAGVHRLSGIVAWERAPATLRIPSATGVVRLSVAGRPVAHPERRDRELWLAAARVRPSAPPAPDILQLNAYRLLSDGIPVTQTVNLQLEVSGDSREVVLGRALPPGWIPTTLDSPLPARVEQDGRLRVQLRPGQWQLTLRARAPAIADTFGFDPGDEGQWPAEEIWSYAADERLRVTTASGGVPVDPAQAGVPGAWRGYPSFRLVRGDVLRIEQRSRGLADTLENRLELEREMWRDFAGDGFTVHDRIHGEMQVRWRLDAVRPYRLASARLSGTDLVVTEGADEALSGVELRAPALLLDATLRLDDPPARLPVSGWQQRFDRMGMDLYLPPGERLLAALGADTAGGAWLERWRLLDYFLVLLIAIGVARLAGTLFGVIALAMLVVTYFEPGAPLGTWIALLVTMALARHAPEGRLRRVSIVLRNAAFLALVLVAVPFIAVQLRDALYPQLEQQRLAPQVASWRRAEQVEAFDAMAPAPAAMNVQTKLAREAAGGAAEEIVVMNAAAPPPRAPDALVQTGPALPEWRFNAYRVSWRGPVAPEQTLRLVILGRGAYRVLRVVGVLLLGLLVWRLAGVSFGTVRLPLRGLSGLGAAALTGLAAVSGATWSPPALAQTPDPALLRELELRLLRAPDCAPRCAELAAAALRVTPDRLEVDLDAQVFERVAVPLPGAAESWLPVDVSVDGNAREWLYRDAQGVLWLALEPGNHRVTLGGPLRADVDTVRITFPESPRRIRASAQGWLIAGIGDGRLLGGAVALQREREDSPDDQAQQSQALEPSEFAPFVQVVRLLSFELDWQVRTELRRVAPARGAFTVEIPLLPGESVTSEGIAQRDRRVIASFADTASTFSWRSQLERSAAMTLQAAAADAPYREVWRLWIGESWRIAHEGTPVIGPPGAQGRWVPEFHPRPGETLALAITQPAPAPGATLTFDRAELQGAVGRRTTEWLLTLAYRSSRGGPHTLQLPADGRIVEVSTDGTPLSVRPVDGALTVPLQPGAHRLAVRWEQGRGAGLWTAMPTVDTGAETGNVTQVLDLAARWVLLTRGPSLGPAVLYWAELLVFLLLAPLLARLPGVALRTREWVLLGIGFGTFSWGVLALLALWLIAMGWRANRPAPAVRWRFNAMQVVLALLTVAALAALVTVTPRALLGTPDLHVTGNGSSAAELRWFTDRSAGELPSAGVLSLPMWSYKAAILAWVLWLSFALLRWLGQAWRAWTRDGLWRGRIARSSRTNEPEVDDTVP